PEPPAGRPKKPAPVPGVPFSRSYWVQHPHFLAGCYPGEKDPHQAREKIDALLKEGVRTIVNLMEEIEIGHDGLQINPYDAILSELSELRGLKTEMVRCPIRDVSITTPEHMRSILDVIDREISRGVPVYVHCWGGRGRTGTVVGCWLIRHGIATGNKALDHIQQLRQRVPDRRQLSPETPAQCEMVRRWYE
ncbi:MAG TPA: hypothetical protein ENI27_08005, partial [bacterium]|nr:hypothetical protein [bacterium]